MRHITILYGARYTGKSYICQKMGWLELVGDPSTLQQMLESNTNINEIGVPILEGSEETKAMRVIIHSHAQMYAYAVRYIDLRVT